MSSNVKKISLAVLLVVFAVGGYFLGRSGLSAKSQLGASTYGLGPTGINLTIDGKSVPVRPVSSSVSTLKGVVGETCDTWLSSINAYANIPAGSSPLPISITSLNIGEHSSSQDSSCAYYIPSATPGTACFVGSSASNTNTHATPVLSCTNSYIVDDTSSVLNNEKVVQTSSSAVVAIKNNTSNGGTTPGPDAGQVEEVGNSGDSTGISDSGSTSEGSGGKMPQQSTLTVSHPYGNENVINWP